jgi:hypothetical protein
MVILELVLGFIRHSNKELIGVWSIKQESEQWILHPGPPTGGASVPKMFVPPTYPRAEPAGFSKPVPFTKLHLRLLPPCQCRQSSANARLWVGRGGHWGSGSGCAS